MDEKTESFGVLHETSKTSVQTHNLVRNRTLSLLDGRPLTPVFDVGCGHLTFVEVPTLHLVENQQQTLDRSYVLKWIAAHVNPSKSDDNHLADCQQKSLKSHYNSPEEHEWIAKFFQIAKSEESYSDRHNRFATQPLEAFKGFRSDLTCLDFQYGVGETFNFKNIELYKQGAHCCLWPGDVFDFYPRNEGNRYFRVLIAGSKHGLEQSVAEEVTLLNELSEDELDELSGVFETPSLTTLRLRGKSVANFVHLTGEVIWH